MSSCPVCGSPVQPNDTVCRTCGAALTPASEVALPAGTTLLNGQYTISKVLGRGGFGITYDAQDVRLGMRVAIKELFIDGSTRRGKTVIPPGSLSTKEYQDTKNRFLDEAKVLARFDDPGIVRVMNYFEENSTAYLVMEFLEGATLGSAIEKRGPVPPEVVLEIARSLTHTLELIHGAGLLHRDIKPDNIFLHKTGRIVLIDFGSVRAFAPGKTVSHTRLVTPGYAPLEQYGNAARYGPYTDIYSLGATLHHALTGQMPPAATDLMLGTPLPPLPASTPPQLRRAVEKMMSLRVEERPQSAQELRQLLSGSPAPAPAPAPQAPPPRPQPAQPTRVAPQPAPAPQPKPPQPKPQPKPAPPQPQPTPAPQPKPQPQPVPKPAPTPVAPPKPAPAPIPQPAPQPRPTPSPVPSLPTPTPVRVNSPAPFSRKLWIFLWMGAGIVLAMLQIQNFAPLTHLDLPEPARYAIAGGVGAVVGALLGWLTWIAMPIVLPLVAAGAAYYFTQLNGVTLPTVIAATIMAADLAILFMWLIRRIRF